MKGKTVQLLPNSESESERIPVRRTKSLFLRQTTNMAGRYQRFPDESDDQAPAYWRKFFVVLAGQTNGAHNSVVQLFKSSGHIEVNFHEDADFCLVFCPVSSRVGTDVSHAMEQLPDGKEAVLVVMHHTFNQEQVIPPSSRLVDKRRVRLTLDVLFHRDKLLKCKLNDNMETDILKFLRASKSNWLCQLIKWSLLVLWSIFLYMVTALAAVVELAAEKTGLKRLLLSVWDLPVFRCMTFFFIAISVFIIYYPFENKTANDLPSDGARTDNDTLSVSEVHRAEVHV